MQYILDTNCLLRFILDDNKDQADIVEGYLKSAAKNKISIFIPIVVVNELVFVLLKLYHFPRADIAKELRSLLEISFLSIEKRIQISKTLAIYGNHNISFVDAFLLAECQESDSELLTFDKKLKSLKLKL